MGLSSSHMYASDFSDSPMFPQNIKRQFIDQRRVGDVSLVVFKHESNDRKLAHQAIFVDVEGVSSEFLLYGVMIHLLADPLTKNTQFWIKDNQWKKNAFDEVIRVGRLQPSRRDPYYWAFYLEAKGYDIFHELTDQYSNIIWSSSVNSQTFVRNWLNRYGFEWPSDLPYANDGILPVIIDESIRRVCLTTTTGGTSVASTMTTNRLRTLFNLLSHPW